MSKFASGTEVSTEKSLEEVRKILRGQKVEGFAYAEEEARAAIMFRLGGRTVQLQIVLPLRTDKEFRNTPSGKWIRGEAQRDEAWHGEKRRRWRALALVLKAKFAAIEAGISTVEREFLADTVLPDGQTVGALVLPRVARALQGQAVPLLPDRVGREQALELEPAALEPRDVVAEEAGS